MKGRNDATTKRARRRHTAEFKRAVVERTLVAGASVAAIALEHQLNANQLFTWRRNHLREMAAAAPRPKMLPVMVDAAETPLIKPVARAGAAGVIEIELAGGRIRLRGTVDEASLRTVVDLLSRR